jgi:hypothetical protein
MVPAMKSYVSMLIRLWREAGPDRPGARWQGEVEHIQSGRIWTFASLDELLAFVRRQADELEMPASVGKEVPIDQHPG